MLCCTVILQQLAVVELTFSRLESCQNNRKQTTSIIGAREYIFAGTTNWGMNSQRCTSNYLKRINIFNKGNMQLEPNFKIHPLYHRNSIWEVNSSVQNVCETFLFVEPRRNYWTYGRIKWVNVGLMEIVVDGQHGLNRPKGLFMCCIILWLYDGQIPDNIFFCKRQLWVCGCSVYHLPKTTKSWNCSSGSKYNPDV